jgi:predicted DNA-binding protein (MmcQ/YjbR family)
MASSRRIFSACLAKHGRHIFGVMSECPEMDGCFCGVSDERMAVSGGKAMNASEFRRLALAVEGAVESAHMNHPDFRIGGKIFATLAAPDKSWGMVKLTPAQQADFVAADPESFRPCSGAWGRSGCTNVRLRTATRSLVKAALEQAVENVVGSNPARRNERTGVTRGLDVAPTKRVAARRVRPPSSKKSKSKTSSRATPIPSPAGALAKLRRICLAFPDTKETVTWGKPHFRVGNKIFAGFDDADGRPVMGCKLAMEKAARIVTIPGFSKAPYVGHKGWVAIDLTAVRDWELVRELVEESYNLIASPAPKRSTGRGDMARKRH